MSSHNEAIFNQGLQHFGDGNYDLAIKSFELCLSQNQFNFEAAFYLGLSYAQVKNYENSIKSLGKALSFDLGSYETLLNISICYRLSNQLEKSLEYARLALNINPNSFQSWLNLGNSLQDLGNYAEALSAYNQSVSLNPKASDVWVNRGNCLNRMNQHQLALISYEQALKLNSEADVWSNYGLTLSDVGQYKKAIQAYENALNLDINHPYVLGSLLHAKMRLCDWTNFNSLFDAIDRKVEKGEKAIFPFCALSLFEDADKQLMASKIFTNDKYPFNNELGHPIRSCSNRIKLGFFSSDFKKHPVSFLTVELFSQLDRNCFELHGFALRSHPRDEMYLRMKKIFDFFHDVETSSDKAITQLSRSKKIDIAIDLNGFTQGGRTAIFAYRAAPVQVNFLGYPGTMGAEYMDYIIADDVVIPKHSSHLFSEKIVRLPNSFQPSDSRRGAPQKIHSRSDFGLPDLGFIYCCFNNSYKITPAIFDVWMRILKGVDDSVLWLVFDHDEIVGNLKKEARLRGVDPSRMYFSPRVNVADYLSRFRVADLFLDTAPFNGGTTLNDALWTGLPVLTCVGSPFAGRMGASLLNALGMHDLIMRTLNDYEYMAINLGRDIKRLSRVRAQLQENLESMPLYDMKTYCNSLESAFKKMQNRSADNCGAIDIN